MGCHRPGLYEKYIKRPLDILLCTLALIVLCVPLLAVACVVRVKLCSPVLFRQRRVGKDDKIFTMLKFRSMTEQRDKNGVYLPDEQRVTPLGSFLRKSSIDELPSLLNIIKGDMSIIGPRPLPVRYLDRYTQTQRRRHEVRPGLSCVSTVRGRNCQTWERQFEMDVWYVDNLSFLVDAKCVWDTLKVAISGRGATAEDGGFRKEFIGTGRFIDVPSAEKSRPEAETAAKENMENMGAEPMRRSVSDLVNDPGLWGGLNSPGIAMSEADVVVCGIPFDGGASFRKGAAEGPRAIREITFSVCPTTEDFEVMNLRVLDQGDIDGQDRGALFALAEARAEEYVRAGKFFTFIGGDHSVTIPIMRGVDRALGHDFGIVHIDAHFDLCDQLGGDPLSHGCTERRALELPGVMDLDSIFFVGIRSAETCEAEFLQGRGANVISAAKYDKLGTKEVVKRIRKKMRAFGHIYVTIDIDALDPACAPGTGTPQFGGLTSRGLLGLLRGIMTDLPVIGFDLVETAPPLDPSNITLFAARKILMESWGHYWRKNT